MLKFFSGKKLYYKKMLNNLNYSNITNKDIFILSTEDMTKFNEICNLNSGKKIIATHSGAFHADEVLATVITRYTDEFNDSWIVRSRNNNILEKADIVVDVGGIYEPSTCRYDHHMKEFNHNFDDKLNIKMSSAGLVYKHHGKNIIENILKSMNLFDENKTNVEKIYEKLYTNFIAYVDGADNGINQYPENAQPRYSNTTSFGHRISRTNPDWYEKTKDESESFRKAQAIAEDEFLTQLTFIVKSYIPAYTFVRKAIDERFKFHESGKIIFLEFSCPWKELLISIEEELKINEGDKIEFALYKCSEQDFRVQTVPISPGNFIFRKGIVKNWRGLEKQKLADISGIKDIIFVHSSGFIGGAKSIESAKQIAIESLITSE